MKVISNQFIIMIALALCVGCSSSNNNEDVTIHPDLPLQPQFELIDENIQNKDLNVKSANASRNSKLVDYDFLYTIEYMSIPTSDIMGNGLPIPWEEFPFISTADINLNARVDIHYHEFVSSPSYQELIPSSSFETTVEDPNVENFPEYITLYKWNSTQWRWELLFLNKKLFDYWQYDKDLGWVAINNVHPNTVLTDNFLTKEATSVRYFYWAWTWDNKSYSWDNNSGWHYTESIDINFPR